MKNCLFLFSLMFILFIPIISYAAETSNYEKANIRVMGVLGEEEGNSNQAEETLNPPREDESTIIKNPDKHLPETGGRGSVISIFLGMTLLFLATLLYLVKRSRIGKVR
ncbi:LPXTG cell wall anchor domain-containing protein [Bacillus thuringiensis]|uniref:LPXTG cell wall anchor domain-containing protein n=1 Tax=Bacillus thuringiensis TaxID=1428 RepID=UPI000BF6F7B4|nr:LPXTG cell wall anchor domain-containing protein [Bacillus thuringiensis]PFN47092.1 hypothetical protein COJ75_30130 [Bacillus thuringiensis]